MRCYILCMYMYVRIYVYTYYNNAEGFVFHIHFYAIRLWIYTIKKNGVNKSLAGFYAYTYTYINIQQYSEF